MLALESFLGGNLKSNANTKHKNARGKTRQLSREHLLPNFAVVAAAAAGEEEGGHHVEMSQQESSVYKQESTARRLKKEKSPFMILEETDEGPTTAAQPTTQATFPRNALAFSKKAEASGG